MAITVQRIKLWHKEVANQPGVLAGVLEPLAAAGVDLEMLMATSFPGDAGLASIGVFPVAGRKAVATAEATGLRATPAMSSLLVSGDNRIGLGRELAQAIAAGGINIGLVVALVVGKNFSAVFGFENEDDARLAAKLMKQVDAAKKPAKDAKAPAKKAGKAAAKKESGGGKTKKTLKKAA